MQTIAVLNPKGGTGKTTCAVNLAAALLTLSKKVLLIDLDPQAQLTRSLGLAADRNVRTVGDLLNTAASPVECIIHRDGLCVIPARPDLAAVEIALAGQKRNAANALASALGNGRLSYDFTLIDTPPSLGLLTVNALAAADRVLVPVNMEPMALPGVERALAAVEEYGQSANAALAVAGIIGASTGLSPSDSRTLTANSSSSRSSTTTSRSPRRRSTAGPSSSMPPILRAPRTSSPWPR